MLRAMPDASRISGTKHPYPAPVYTVLGDRCALLAALGQIMSVVSRNRYNFG